MTDKTISLNVNDSHPIITKLTEGMTVGDKKKLFALLAKNLPVARIQNNDVHEKEYSEDEIKKLIEETYTNLKSTGMDEPSLQRKMADTEPFSKEIYFNYLVEFFVNNGGED